MGALYKCESSRLRIYPLSCYPNTCPHSKILQPLCDPHNSRSEFGHSEFGHDGKSKFGRSPGVYEN